MVKVEDRGRVLEDYFLRIIHFDKSMEQKEIHVMAYSILPGIVIYAVMGGLTLRSLTNKIQFHN